MGLMKWRSNERHFISADEQENRRALEKAWSPG